MDDILNTGSDEFTTSPVDLGDLVETNPTTTSVPMGAVRNRAATSAILSGKPDQMIEKYRLLLQEGSEGSSVTHDEVMRVVADQNRTQHMQQVINILGDKNVPMEQKRQIMNLTQNGGFKEEPAVTLQTKALTLPSQGEDVKGEAARISLADTMAGINREAQERQRMLNGFVAAHPDVGAETVGDMAAADVLPFGRNIIGAKVAAAMDEQEGKPFSLSSFVKNFLLPGSTRQDLQDRLQSIPPDKRDAFTQKLLTSIKDSAAIFHSDNYYAQYQTAVRLLEEPNQSKGEVWTENLMTVLDALWVGGEAKATLQAAKGVGKAADAVFDTSKARRPGSANPGVSDAENVMEHPKWDFVDRPYNPNQIGNPKPRLEYKRADTQKRIELNSVVRRENPVTPYSVMEQANPESARAMHQAILDGDDEIAQALTGTTREQAIANNIYPQVGTESGAVDYKVDQDLKDVITNTGATRYTPDELASAANVIKHDFRNASGLQINDAMTTFRVDGDHIYIDGHYSTPGGSFLTPEAARTQAQYALSTYGIRDEEITIMKRDGMTYVPISAEDTKPGDYIIKVNTKLPIRDEDVGNWNPLDVKRNFFDRISQTMTEDKGSLSGWLFDPGSMLHPTLTGSASVAADQSVVLENYLLKPIKEFRSTVGKFAKDRKAAIQDYIKEANTNGIQMDHFDLVARGFNHEEINALKQWKNIWDRHHYLENYDMVRTLRAQDYKVLDSGGNKLFAKYVPKNQNIGAVLDPATGNVRSMSIAEMDSLYNNGGSYAKLRRPINIGGKDVEHVMVRNTPSEYLRGLRDTDKVLNYRHGYYTVHYQKGAKFVDEILSDGTRRTVAVAGNSKDASTFAKAQEASTGNKHVIREDSRGFEKDGDGYWDVNHASGRIAQRLRGQPLVTAQGINQLGTGVYVENPMESASRAARSLSGRTVTRPVLETAKKRFITQFSEMLPSDGMGGKRFPNHMSEIVDHNSHVSKRVADARTTYQYIKYLEDGYINTADQIYKGLMHVIADVLKESPKLETAVNKAAQTSVTQLAKSVVFNAYIVGANPVRQWIVQSHQATRMAAYNPVGFANGGMLKRIVGYIGEYAGFKQTDKDIQAFVKFVEESGMVAGVDRNSLARGLGIELADNSWTATKVVEHTRAALQTIGFDVGEKMNQLGHLAAVHEKWIREGKNLADKTMRDLAMTEARALSYDLNSAGELTYTKATPALVLQFLQMPHKAWLQLTNRKLPLEMRLRLAAYDLVMFGVGGGATYQGLSWLWSKVGQNGDDLLPNDPEHRDMFVYGMESFALNKMFSMMDDSGEKTRIDFSALAPNDMDGWARMYRSMLDQGTLATIGQSPIGQMLAVNGVNGSKRNGRIPQAIFTLGRYFNVFEELDPTNPTEFTAVLNDAAKISSLWTTAQNAKLMLETRKKLDGVGAEIDSHVTIPEALASGLGFGTLSTKELYQISQHRAQDKKAHEADVEARYRDILAYYKDNIKDGQVEHAQKVTSMLLRTFDEPGDMDLVLKWWKRDMAGKEIGLTKQMLEGAGLPDSRHFEDDIKLWNTDQDTKDTMLERVKDMREVRKLNKENNG